jgi:hypothetical protein
MAHTIQEWLAFAVFGIAMLLTAVVPALPAAVNAEYFSLGTLLVFAAAVGLFVTSETVLDVLDSIEERLAGEPVDE